METLKQIYASPETFKEIERVTDQVNMELLKFKIGLEHPKKNLFIKEGNEFDTKLAKDYLASIKENSREQLGSINSSAWVMAVQIILETLGYDIGKIDGVLGPQTKNGVSVFQQEAGLQQDGLPGKDTITKLLEEVDAQTIENSTVTQNKESKENITPLKSKEIKEIPVPQKNLELKQKSEDQLADEKFSSPEEIEKSSKYIKYLLQKNAFDKNIESNIKKYGPIVIKEAQKYPETKNIIPKIFAQVWKESRRNTDKTNTNGEHSVGLFQINKAAGHKGYINNKYYDIDSVKGNIQYGIAYLTNCIKTEGGNIARGLDRYNGTGNFAKASNKRYSHSIINDNVFA